MRSAVGLSELMYLAHVKPFSNCGEDFTSIECHDGVIIPDVVLAEMLRRKGWTVFRG